MNVKSYVLMFANLGVAISTLFLFVTMYLNGGVLLIYEYNQAVILSELAMLAVIVVLDAYAILRCLTQK
jgi:hypothetical protein